MMSSGLKDLGSGYVFSFIERLDHPLAGLCAGILITALIQSSSATTSVTVGLVAEGVIPLETAIPIVMGANIGTTITNLIVSLGQLTRRAEFERAFSAAVVHDVFNILTVCILFPIQVATNFLGRLAMGITCKFEFLGLFKYDSPVDYVTNPIIDLLDPVNPYFRIILSVFILYVSLALIVKNMKKLIHGRIQSSITKTMGNPPASFLAGVGLTATVQSSSVTTSLLVPMVGADIITVEDAYPYMLGSNIGTTITAFIAAIAIGEEIAVAVAFSHFLFNVFGTLIWYPLKRVPITISKFLGEVARNHRIAIILYVVSVFILLPAVVLFLFGVL